MTRDDAIRYVSFVVDTEGNGRELGADQFAKIYARSRLIGWQCGFEPLFVAVHSADFDDNSAPLDTVDDEEAEQLAIAYLRERGWFGDNDECEADYVI
ncbi:MAG: hypothetical protein QM234_04235 [Acidobacteriota bacterium]|nr:hypothetical protein [Acidobacteriota bacterium]